MHRLMIAPAMVIALGARIQAQCVGRNKRSALRRSCVAEVTDGVTSPVLGNIPAAPSR